MHPDKQRMRAKPGDLGDSSAGRHCKQGRGIGTPAANAADSRRTGPSNASALDALRFRSNTFTANRPRLVESRHDRCTALGPLATATSGPVGAPSPKASATGHGEGNSFICSPTGSGSCHNNASLARPQTRPGRSSTPPSPKVDNNRSFAPGTGADHSGR
jgi:hypothetical protein